MAYNVSNPVNSRVLSAQILCRKCEIPSYFPLVMGEWYRLVMPSWIGAGGNGFFPFKNRINYKQGDIKDVDAISTYFSKSAPYLPKKLGRITVVS